VGYHPDCNERTVLKEGDFVKKIRLLIVVTFVMAVALLAASATGAQDEGRIGGTVYLDENADGVRDTGEPGVEAVTIHIGNETYETSMTTAPDGRYSWRAAGGATWTVTVIPPEGYEAIDPVREVFMDIGGEVGDVDFGLVTEGTTLPTSGAPISPAIAAIGLVGLLVVGVALVVIGQRRR
jgi:hypothetical protein